MTSLCINLGVEIPNSVSDFCLMKSGLVLFDNAHAKEGVAKQEDEHDETNRLVYD